MTLYLIGTAHLDVLGPKRLEKILNHINPSSIAVECDEELAKKTTKEHSVTEKHSTLLSTLLGLTYGEKADAFMQRILLTKGYEIWVPEAYRTNNPETDILYLDDSAVDLYKDTVMTDENLSSEDFSKEMDEMLIEQLNCTDEEYQKIVDDTYDETDIDASPDVLQKVYIERDEEIASKLRSTFSSVNGDLVYVGGSAHMFGNYHNLYEMLKDLNPVRIKLKDAEQFVASKAIIN